MARLWKDKPLMALPSNTHKGFAFDPLKNPHIYAGFLIVFGLAFFKNQVGLGKAQDLLIPFMLFPSP